MLRDLDGVESCRWPAYPARTKMKKQSLKIAIGSHIHSALARIGMDLVRVGDGSHLQEIRRSMRHGMLLNVCEASQITDTAKATEKIPGDLAEIGVYRGGSAKLICGVKGTRPLHLFDTFEGLPSPTREDGLSRFWSNQFQSQIDGVREYLKPYPQVFLYKGLFPATAYPIQDRKFSFVHIDVDLHDSTAASLRWFYPRMSPSGIIMCHDYSNAAGVRKAVDDFFADKPEVVIQQPAGSHCLIVKA